MDGSVTHAELASPILNIGVSYALTHGLNQAPTNPTVSTATVTSTLTLIYLVDIWPRKIIFTK